MGNNKGLFDGLDDFIDSITGELDFANLFEPKGSSNKKSKSSAPQTPKPPQVTADEKKANREALKAFVASRTTVNHLSNLNSYQSLKQGMIEIIYESGVTVMTGMLITEHGFFVTNHDCLNAFKGSRLRVRTADGKTHKILGVCATSREQHIAIFKADIPGKAKAMKYKFSNREYGTGGFDIHYLFKKDKEQIVKAGTVHDPRPRLFKYEEKTVVDQIQVDGIDSKLVNKGALVCSLSYELVGIGTGYVLKPSSTTCTPWRSVVDLIQNLLDGKAASKK